MKKKNGFTLIELMAVLSILAILLLILGVTFIQSQKLLNKISIQNNEQDDVRNAILQIETLANNAEEIIVSNSVDYSLERKLLISIVKNNIEYKIIEKKAENSHQLIITDSNESEKTLLDNIDKDQNTYDGFALNAEKDNTNGDLITINFKNIRENMDKNYSLNILKNEDSIISVGKDDEDESNEDFLLNIIHNVNIAGEVQIYNSNNKYNVIEGSIGYLSISGHNQTTPPGTINSKLEKIEFRGNRNVIKNNITISSYNNNLDKAITVNMKNGEIYRIYLVDGDVNLEPIHIIENSIIIATGNIIINSDESYGEDLKEFTVKNSIIWANGMEVENKNVLRIQGEFISEILNKETVDNIKLKDKINNLLSDAKIEVLEELEVRVFTEANWGNEAQYRIEITNNTKIDIKEWTITFTLEDDKKILSVWDGWANLVSNVGKNQLKSSDGKAMSTGEWVNELKIGQTQIVKGNFTGGSDIGEVRINSITTSYK